MSKPRSLVRMSALGGAALCSIACALAPQAAVAGPVGQLYCNVSGGVGFIITSRRALNCEFSPAGGAQHQHYIGTISRFGLDIGSQGPSKLTWDVVSLGGPVGPGALAGEYTGGSASATLGVGLGANALVGGNGGISLQPLSVQTTEGGANLAAGVGAMSLDYAP